MSTRVYHTTTNENETRTHSSDIILRIK